MLRFFVHVWGNFKEYIVLVALLIISLLTLSLNNKPAVRSVQTLAFSSFAVFTSIVSDLVNTGSVKAENQKLRRLNAELMLKVNLLREYGIENTELKTLLALKDSTKYPLIAATIVSKSINKSQSTITLNVGSKDGVLPGMPVINDFGLLGIVYSTSGDFCIVQTLKNLELKLTVTDERSRINGIMEWDGVNLVIIDVPRTYDIEPGDRIITSEISSIVPVPLPVGLVSGISKGETGLFNEVRVKPFVDFIGAEHVFVIKLVKNLQKDNLELNFYKRK